MGQKFVEEKTSSNLNIPTAPHAWKLVGTPALWQYSSISAIRNQHDRWKVLTVSSTHGQMQEHMKQDRGARNVWAQHCMCESNPLEFSIRNGHQFDIHTEIETRKIMKVHLCLTEVQTPNSQSLSYTPPQELQGLDKHWQNLKIRSSLHYSCSNWTDFVHGIELQQAQQLCQIRINPISCQRVIDDSLRSKLGSQT